MLSVTSVILLNLKKRHHITMMMMVLWLQFASLVSPALDNVLSSCSCRFEFLRTIDTFHFNAFFVAR